MRIRLRSSGYHKCLQPQPEEFQRSTTSRVARVVLAIILERPAYVICVVVDNMCDTCYLSNTEYSKQ